MKKISELGLELIELEGQILLVEKEKKLSKNGDWYLSHNNNIIHKWEMYGIHEGKQAWITKIVASTKPLEGLPLLVIKDYINIPEFYLQLEKLRFQQGYDKARETFKFTEEDLRRAIDIARETLEYDERRGWYETKSEEEIIQSLTKKELWVDVEEKHFRTVKNNDGKVIDHQFTIQPKITNNQIKAIRMYLT